MTKQTDTKYLLALATATPGWAPTLTDRRLADSFDRAARKAGITARAWRGR